MDNSLATLPPHGNEEIRDSYRRRSPARVERSYRRVSRSRSRERYRSRTPERRRRYSRSPSPRRHYSSYRRSPPPPRYTRRPREVIRGSEEERARTSSIFVGNLPYNFEERDVVNLFERFGRLRQVSVPIDRYTRRNRGFAFIEFEQRPDAEDAFNKYNGYEMEGRKMRLDWDIGLSAKDRTRDHSPRRERSPARDVAPRRSPRDSHPERSPARHERETERVNDYR